MFIFRLLGIFRIGLIIAQKQGLSRAFEKIKPLNFFSKGY
jgi:hypothetical protein